jgi:hypothetical protein
VREIVAGRDRPWSGSLCGASPERPFETVASPSRHGALYPSPQKWLKAGVLEDGEWTDTTMGTPQGAVVSPILANIYLHYVFDLWVDAWRKRFARGEVVVVGYADDNVLGFHAGRTLTVSWSISGRGSASSGWNCTLTKRAGSSSAGSPNRTGHREGKASPRRSTFSASRT